MKRIKIVFLILIFLQNIGILKANQKDYQFFEFENSSKIRITSGIPLCPHCGSKCIRLTNADDYINVDIHFIGRCFVCRKYFNMTKINDMEYEMEYEYEYESGK